MVGIEIQRQMIRASVMVVMAAACAGQATAQLPSASTRALGMGDNYTAIARGYAAVSWNPAMLGLAGNPGASLAIAPTRVIYGLSPVTLKDFKDVQGEVVPVAVREQWLKSIEADGSEQGTGGGDVTALAVQVGRFGVQLGTVARVVSNLSPGAAELVLFGNAGRTGQPRTIAFGGSDIRIHAVSTLGFSFAIPLGRSDAGQSAIGFTGKYSVGHGLFFGEDQGSTVTADPALNVNFPVISTKTTGSFNVDGGNGFGLDVGFVTRRGHATVAATVKNVLNTFKWDVSNLEFRRGIAKFDANTKDSDFEAQAYANAPAALKQLVEDAKYKPSIAAGIAFESSPKLTVSADLRTRTGESTIAEEPKLHAGIGAEFRVIPLLPIRGGVALTTGGYQIGGGLGLNLGPLNLAASVARRKDDVATGNVLMLTLISTTGR